MHEPNGAAESVLRQVGRRNLAYLVFAALLAAAALAVRGSARPPGHSIALGLIAVWVAVSSVFLFANALMLIGAVLGGRRDVPALIACLLPPLIALLGWLSLQPGEP
jgi:hypothetical protein